MALDTYPLMINPDRRRDIDWDQGCAEKQARSPPHNIHAISYRSLILVTVYFAFLWLLCNAVAPALLYSLKQTIAQDLSQVLTFI